MASVPESNHIGNFVTDEQYLNVSNFIGNGDEIIPPISGNYIQQNGFNFIQQDGVSVFLEN